MSHTKMSRYFSQRLAREILTSYGNEGSFDLDFIDGETSDAVALELQRLGCEVIRWPFKSAIHVIVTKRVAIDGEDVAVFSAADH